MNKETQIVDALESVKDPHIPVSIEEMGMLSSVDVDGSTVEIGILFPCLGCPAYQMIINDVESTVSEFEWVNRVDVRTTWETEWNKDEMSMRAREQMAELGVQL